MVAFLILALCNGALTMTLTKSRFFRAPRVWIADRSDFFGELSSCPYCMTHWVGLIATFIFRQKFTNVWWPIDYLVAYMALVASSAFVAGVIYRLFTPPTVRAEDVVSLLTQK